MSELALAVYEKSLNIKLEIRQAAKMSAASLTPEPNLSGNYCTVWQHGAAPSLNEPFYDSTGSNATLISYDRT